MIVLAIARSADLLVGTLIVIIGMLLQLFLPWIPGLRDIPRLIPLYKIFYRRYYKKHSSPPALVTAEPEPQTKSPAG